MPSTAILHEVQRLYGVSDRLDALADQHPIVSEALLSISVSVRNTCNIVGSAGCDEDGAADFWSRFSKCLIC